ncbi:MAG: histidinol-phosphate transaminase [Candidatus Metalachnospira sp.]|nr:histidinol-phosphate transaminase [Candidatus Metalachnospira sp.]
MGKFNVAEKNNKNILDFSVNVNMLGMPQSVKDACKYIQELCCFYPDEGCSELRNALAKKHGLEPENFLCGNGADDIIFRIPLAFKPKKALILAPTYEEYKNALETVNCEINYCILDEKKGFRADYSILNAVTPDIDIVYICNPNNPTGISIEVPLIKKLAEVCRNNNALLVIDECFIGFMISENCSMKNYINDFDNIVIIDAFTKLYCIPGFRLGYCISSNRKILENIKRAGQDFAVSIPAQIAGIAALEDNDYIETTQKIVSYESRWLINEIRKFGIKVYDAEANFIFIKSPFDGFQKKLLDKGVKVRYCGNFVGLQGEHIRIAVRKHEDNEKFIDAVKEIFI